MLNQIKQWFKRGHKPRAKDVEPALLPTQRESEDLPRLTLAEYRQRVAVAPRPSSEQCRQFCLYVADHHSWYKSPVYCLPGIPAHVFVDPDAGRIRRVVSGAVNFYDPSEVPGQPEPEMHREQFGYLSYVWDDGVNKQLRGIPDRGSEESIPGIIGDDGRLLGLPREVFDAGLFEITAPIHSIDLPGMWLHHERLGRFSEWPEEAGGPAQLRAILARCRDLERDPGCREEPEPGPPRDSMLVARNPSLTPDAVLADLVVPERLRLRKRLLAAIERVVALVYD